MIPSWTTHRYDAAAREREATLYAAGTRKWSTVTDPAADTTIVTPPFGGKTATSTDGFGRTTAVSEDHGAPTSATTRYAYTVRDEIAKITDADGNATTHTFDWTGQPLTGDDPDAGVSSRFVNGQAYRNEALGYDARYRPTGKRVTIPAAEGALAGQYDYRYGYDRADHVTDTTYPAAGGLPAETVTAKYSPNTGTALALSSDLGTGYTYVKHNYYWSTGEPAERDYGENGGIARRTAMRTCTDQIPQRQCFTYDGVDRLKEAWTTTVTENCAGGSTTADQGGPDPYRLAYTYSKGGNIQTVTDGPTTRTYTYPASGAGAVRPHAVTKIGNGVRDDTYQYDDTGQMTSRTVGGATTALEWDALHKLTAATTNGAKTGFTYDAGGSRLIRRDGGGALYLDGMELRDAGGTVKATRYYTLADATGRFINPDPVINTDSPQGLNPYAYGDNNPATFSDPTGLWSIGGFWNKYKGTIVNVSVTIAVTAGCEAATLGTGTIGCAFAGGAAGGLAEYLVSHPSNQWSVAGAAQETAVGGATGILGWGAAKAAAPVLSKLAGSAAGRATGDAASRVGAKAKSLAARPSRPGRVGARGGERTAAKARPRKARAGVEGAGLSRSREGRRRDEDVRPGDRDHYRFGENEPDMRSLQWLASIVARTDVRVSNTSPGDRREVREQPHLKAAMSARNTAGT